MAFGRFKALIVEALTKAVSTAGTTSKKITDAVGEDLVSTTEQIREQAERQQAEERAARETAEQAHETAEQAREQAERQQAEERAARETAEQAREEAEQAREQTEHQLAVALRELKRLRGKDSA